MVSPALLLGLLCGQAELKVLSWNLYGGRRGMEAVVDVLRASQAEVFLLQEAAPARSGAEDPARRLSAAFPQWSLARGGSRGELLIMSRAPLTGRRQHKLSRGRPCLLAEREGLTLVNVHFSTAVGERSLAQSGSQWLEYLHHTSAIRSEQTDALLQKRGPRTTGPSPSR